MWKILSRVVDEFEIEHEVNLAHWIDAFWNSRILPQTPAKKIFGWIEKDYGNNVFVYGLAQVSEQSSIQSTLHLYVIPLPGKNLIQIQIWLDNKFENINQIHSDLLKAYLTLIDALKQKFNLVAVPLEKTPGTVTKPIKTKGRPKNTPEKAETKLVANKYYEIKVKHPNWDNEQIATEMNIEKRTLEKWLDLAKQINTNK